MDNLGGKAKALLDLQNQGFNIPDFIVISAAEYHSLDRKRLDDLLIELGESPYYAVRSSSNAEDGEKNSFAGMFSSYLFVQKEDLLDRIHDVASSAQSERVVSYLDKNNIDPTDLKMNIIIQKMINADISGVAFSKNPMKPYLNEQIISTVYGIGEGIVSGSLNADQYTKKNDGTWKKQIVKKEQKLTFIDGQLKYISLNDQLQNNATLTTHQLEEISKLLKQLEMRFGNPQDIEFCYRGDRLYLLQSRPITSIDKNKEHIIWDNSNIIESYPGITLPFTFSFIIKIYEAVYYNFGKILGVPHIQLDANKDVFAEMLGHIKGRVYYHLINWYKALAMLPAYKMNAPYMEKMMGVSEPLGVDFTLKQEPSKLSSYFHLLNMIFNLIKINQSLPKKKAAFTKKVSNVISRYKKKNYSEVNDRELWNDYTEFKKLLITEWTPPLANDLLAMIYYGVLGNLCHKWLDRPSLQNELIIGKHVLKSVLPAKLIEEIILKVHQEDRFDQLEHEDEQIIWNKCLSSEFGKSGQLIKKYIDLYGDRSVGELKLENITYTQAPENFIKILKSYKNTATAKHKIEPSTNPFNDIKLPYWKKKIFKYVVKKASETIADRENLRFDRTFAFGVIRRFIRILGKRWSTENILHQESDIFYLHEKEIQKFIFSEMDKSTITNLIETRKVAFEEYSQIKALPKRIHQYGSDLNMDTEDDEVVMGQLKGIPCCAGEVVGKVRILEKADEVSSLDGDILVTTSTDPGWITIFQSASAIIVERGSTLSHAAIVSREMGIPCIVGVGGVTSLLNTGDTIKMNGRTGHIEIL